MNKKRLICFVLSTSVMVGLSACNSNSDNDTSTLNTYNNSFSDTSSYGISSESAEESSDLSTYNQISINPFEGLEVQFDGISPYCSISFNNSKCSLEVQNNVEYSISKESITTSEYLKKDQEVTVYAFLKSNSGLDENDVEYSLSSTEKIYTVQDVPEYITEITDDMDFSQFKSELKDYYDSITAWQQGDFHVFGTTKGYFVSSSQEKEYDTYFSNLKVNKYDIYSKDVPFNRIDVLFSIQIANTSYEAYTNFDPTPGEYFTRYFTIYAENIIKYPDGKIMWGKIDPNELDFNYKVNSNNLNDLISDVITSKKSDYNSEKITDKGIKVL